MRGGIGLLRTRRPSQVFLSMIHSDPDDNVTALVSL
jgi:hypothetical protein